MVKFHVKKGDQVTVISGKEKGKSGKIIAVLTDQSRVVVEGLQMIKHTKRASRTRTVPSSNAKAPYISNVKKAETAAA